MIDRAPLSICLRRPSDGTVPCDSTPAPLGPNLLIALPGLPECCPSARKSCKLAAVRCGRPFLASMDIPGAFARPGCVARCCRDVLDELTFCPLFERRDENLDAILEPADLAALLLRDEEWGNDTPRTERARVLAKELPALSETRVLHILDRLDLCREKFTNVRLTPDEEPTDETIIGVVRTTCIGCGQKLPEHSVTKATDPHRGDGEEYRSKRVRPDVSIMMKVLSRRGEVCRRARGPSYPV